eukprot:scaffold88389_cov21-Tisochrysis_lutea.AAC.1
MMQAFRIEVHGMSYTTLMSNFLLLFMPKASSWGQPVQPYSNVTVTSSLAGDEAESIGEFAPSKLLLFYSTPSSRWLG